MTGPPAPLPRRESLAIASLAISILLTGLVCGTRVAGGADSYGYVSQARLWLEGRALAPQPLAFDPPWQHGAASLSPLGYRPSLDGRGIVPVYPPGLPLTMALAMAIGGQAAVFAVVPLFGALAVSLTAQLGYRIGGSPVALAGAALTAASPTFLYQLVQPMSDVPATACWLAAIVSAFGATPRASLCAGMAAALAILIRPNLVPIAAIPILLVARSAPRDLVRELALVIVPIAVSATAIGWLQYHWYGSPLVSGYGRAPYLYAASRIPGNAGRYVSWLSETHTPLVFFGLLSPFLASNRMPSHRSLAMICLIASALVLVCYLPYLQFDDWSYTRFLLPAIPLLWATAGATLAGTTRKMPRVAFGVVAGVIAFELYAGWSHGVYRLPSSERRYPAVASVVRELTPAHAAVLTVQHSGTLRAYGSRLTVRWDAINPAQLDEAVAYLRTHERPPFLALEDGERQAFVDRFAGASAYGRLGWRPVTCRNSSCLYDLTQAATVMPRLGR